MRAPTVGPETVSILLVDDRPNNLLSLEALLRRPDYNLVLARSGTEALAHVLRQEFALILLDVAMPGMDGFQTATIIKEREQSSLIPIIFITAAVYDLEHIFRGYTVGAVDYLRKPVDPHALRSKVAVFVELYRQRKQNERQAVRLREAERRLRERAEEALQESESLYQLTFEEVPVGIGHTTADGRWIRANRRLCDILGSSPEVLVSRRIEEMADGEERAVLEDRLAALRAGASYYSGEHRVARADGSRLWVELTLATLREPVEGVVRQILAVLDDIQARKEAELERSRLVGELQRGIRARDDFLSLAAHELKTPLTPLRLQTQSLLRAAAELPEPLTPQELYRRLQTIDRSAWRLELLVERLLDASRLHAGAVTLELEDVDLVEVAHDVLSQVARDAERAGCSICLRAGAPLTGRWDRLRLEQILSNLLSNAIKYGAGKPIEVEVCASDGQARLSVRDQGVGIAAAEQERIFERFERVASRQHFGGFGLGLWIVRQLAEAHGGSVAVRSQPGRGAVFDVELPRRPTGDREEAQR